MFKYTRIINDVPIELDLYFLIRCLINYPQPAKMIKLKMDPKLIAIATSDPLSAELYLNFFVLEEYSLSSSIFCSSVKLSVSAIFKFLFKNRDFKLLFKIRLGRV